MDKKETTRLLNNLIEYNRVDINNMRGTFPELGDAFMNVILAIDEEYGSGNIDRNLLRTPAPQPLATNDFEEFGKQFVGRFLYKEGSKVWLYFDSLTKYDEAQNEYTFKIYTNRPFSISNVAEEQAFFKNDLETLLSGGDFGNWKLFNLKVGDKVKIPETKMGVKIATSTIPIVINRTLKRNQDYLYIKDLYDILNGNYYLVLTDDLKNTGDYFIMQDVTPYQQATASRIQVGEYFKGKKWRDSEWVLVKSIEKDINGEETVYGLDEKGEDYKLDLDSVNDFFSTGEFYFIPPPKNAVQTTKVDFKEGDRFYVQYSPKELYTIKKINQNDIIIGYTNIAGKYSENSRTIKDAQENFDNGTWILSGKSTPSVKYITQWTPDWKARGLRPSPTRKASLEKIDALGLGNDGAIYQVDADKRGVKKWKKTGFTTFNGNNRKDFSSRYDLELLYDQLVYENTQLQSTDIEYKENENLIKTIINELI